MLFNRVLSINLKSSGDIKFHYHNYDRKYENEGVLDDIIVKLLLSKVKTNI